ncbi:hypothetical protein [Hymenobacter sp. UYP22]|uniref:hypothetical protein n=1 Tax=Hymenobacter sp. UYP22 TaxID=3156348 RepID=UPI003398C926
MQIIDINQEGIKALLLEAFTAQARAYFHTLPAPDPQYTADEVSELLCIDVATVRSYLKLPATHPRHLPAVRCTDTAWGYRIVLSDIRAWQQRNKQPEETTAQEPEALLRISHRRANRRNRATGREAA